MWNKMNQNQPNSLPPSYFDNLYSDNIDPWKTEKQDLKTLDVVKEEKKKSKVDVKVKPDEATTRPSAMRSPKTVSAKTASANTGSALQDLEKVDNIVVLRKGWIYKKGKYFFSKWHPKWAVLQQKIPSSSSDSTGSSTSGSAGSSPRASLKGTGLAKLDLYDDRSV